MSSVVDKVRSKLEARGEYVVRANISSGWFAIFPGTWAKRELRAQADGRPGPNLIVYRTRSGWSRDHHVVPYHTIQELLLSESLTHSSVNGVSRWNLTLRDDVLHVSHLPGGVGVSHCRGAALLIEEGDEPSPEEVLPTDVFREGAVTQVLVNRYERDRSARSRCIAHHGVCCSVCGLSLEVSYGPAVAGLIHVHHIRPLSEVGAEYELDPITDLRPVCPNCHAVIHSRRPPYSLHEMASMLEARLGAKSVEGIWRNHDDPDTTAGIG